MNDNYIHCFAVNSIYYPFLSADICNFADITCHHYLGDHCYTLTYKFNNNIL